MKVGIFIPALLALLTLISCNSEPSLQKYFVENTENKDFIALDVSPSILNLEKTKLSPEQNEALKSFDKMNILAFKANDKNQAQFETERAKVKAILKNTKYQELMKVGSGKDGASISYVGTDENIEEFIIFANRKENGFAVVRVLGKNMNPNNIITLISVLKESKIDMEQLKPLQELVK
ncbi:MULTISPECIES: DUF4252 domain-containing protein [Flavobacterium]|uniref:DUF4252 domain-containing protein n=1 Tax=Flavobacterium salmonis TaxID=2654844 RepID=A0A6V6Z066_9FLAO|nr:MULTISPECIES: DUF4252 domain-containing protein [Flavobacterium]OOV18552.1 hypothetical protein BXU10_02260 [Flavobacterium sp. LM4]CAD0005056.1 hypothetical protein FLAT13_02557 [Flavobacterium salmonis]